MAAVVTLAQVSVWLDSTKMGLSTLDAVLEESVRTQVFAHLGQIYDTSNWVDVNSTPALVQQIVSLWVAGNEYNRKYSQEAASGNTYGDTLIATGQRLLDSLVNRTLDIPNVEALKHGVPTFHRTDPIFTMGWQP
jgi:hypothetical protein